MGNFGGHRVGQSARRRLRCLLGMVVVLAVGVSVLPRLGAAEAVGAAPVPAHETEAETIQRCLEDAGSGDVLRRRRAVLILGKYRAPVAMAAVVACLRDEDDEVRRSAAVAVAEWEVMPRSAQAEMLRLVRDPSVPVRRVASSVLPEILGGQRSLDMALLRAQVAARSGRPAPADLGAVLSLPGRGAGDATAMDGSPLEGAAVAGILNDALSDPDATVRRHVLSAARMVPGVLTCEALEPLVRDDDREIRILAVQALAQVRGEEARRAGILAGVLGDPDVGVRREAARSLGRLGGDGFAGLERLSADADPGVRLQAVQELVQLQHPEGLALLERCVLDDAIGALERRDLLLYAGFYGAAAEPLLRRLAGSSSAVLRAEAIRGLSRLSGADGARPDFLLASLEDASGDVRRVAAQALARWAVMSGRSQGEAPAWPTVPDLAGLQASPYADVRLLAVRLSTRLDPLARLEVLTEACLDDDLPVRLEALQHLAVLGTPAAFEMLTRSLDDPDPAVAMAAVRALSMRPQPQALAILQAFHERCRDDEVRAAVAAVLEDLRPPPAVPAVPEAPGAPSAPVRGPYRSMPPRVVPRPAPVPRTVPMPRPAPRPAPAP
ncbi:MAG: hypothetical protein GX595_11630 [Lentisphaerae bacterium]|nr:hypothetical protein [Lentisphaerota bacterium]